MEMNCEEEHLMHETANHADTGINGEKGLVSIIVPVYNVEKYLEACVRSVQAQTYRHFELLLVDDGSKDGSGALCDKLAAKDSRIRVIHKQNEGVSATRNRGIDESRGQFIVFVDSDDQIRPEMLRKMVRAITHYHTDLALSGFERFRPGWSQEVRLSPHPLVIFESQKELISVYKQANTNMFGISIWAKMYRADIIRRHNIRFQTDISYEEDCCFNIDYFHHIHSAAVLRECFYRYRQMEQSLSKGYRKNTFKFLVNGYRRRIAYMKELGVSRGGADAILMIVVKATVQKIFHSDLPKEEKLAEYAMIMDFPECKRVCANSVGSRVWLTRELCKAVASGEPKKVHRVMQVAKYGSAVKGKFRALGSKIKWICKKVLRRV